MNSSGLNLRPSEVINGQIDQLKYRVLNLVRKKYGDEPVSIAFTSYRSGEGVSTVASNFAIALSMESACNVLLVDCNLKKPGLSKIFGLNGRGKKRGQEAIEDKTAIRDRQIANVHSNLDVIFSQIKGDAKERSINMGQLNHFLQAARLKYNYVVIDCPALSAASYSTLLATKADALVLVVEAERVRRQVLKCTIEQLEELGANICGIVLNKRRYPIPNFIYKML